jgi:hypothetical protein
MTTEEVLEQQVEVLEKLLKLKQALIEELEAKVGRLEMENGLNRLGSVPWGQPIHVQSPFISVFDPCPIGPTTHHEYPLVWHGTIPPPCSKCGKPQNMGGAQAGGLAGGITGIGSSNNAGQASVSAANNIGTVGDPEALKNLIDTIKNR